MLRQPDNDLALDSRFSWALSTVNRLLSLRASIRTVFDIGAGNETLATDVRQLGLEYFSFDLVPQTSSTRLWNVEEPFPYDERADVVLCLEMLEHLNNPWLAIKNIANVIRPGGYVILSTPNPAWSGSRLSLVARGTLAMFTEHDLVVNHHVFTPWRHIVERVLTDNGLMNPEFTRLGKATSVFASPFWGLKAPLRFSYRLIKILVEKIDPQATGAMYGVVAERTAP